MEPRFTLEGDATGLVFFACHNLDQIVPGASQMGLRARDALFNDVVAWCTEQFGPAIVRFERGDDDAILPGQWKMTRRCIVVTDDTLATAFRVRWC